MACFFQWALSLGGSGSLERQPHSSGDYERDSCCAVYRHGFLDWERLLAGGARLVHWNADDSFIKAIEGTMLIIFMLVTAIVFGILPGLFKLDKMFSLTNIVVGFVGALFGAFLGFGDAPLLLKYPFLNEITLMVAVSFLFVVIKVSVTGKRIVS